MEVQKGQFLKCLLKKRVGKLLKVLIGGEKEGTRVRWKDIINCAQEEDELDKAGRRRSGECVNV